MNSNAGRGEKPRFRVVTADEIEKGKTKRGAHTRKRLAEWGVKWPPAKGWKKRLMRGEDPNDPKQEYLGHYQHEYAEIAKNLFDKMTPEQMNESIAFMERLVGISEDRSWVNKRPNSRVKIDAKKT